MQEGAPAEVFRREEGELRHEVRHRVLVQDVRGEDDQDITESIIISYYVSVTSLSIFITINIYNIIPPVLDSVACPEDIL